MAWSTRVRSPLLLKTTSSRTAEIGFLPNGLPQYSQRLRVTQREFPPWEVRAFVTLMLSAGLRVL